MDFTNREDVTRALVLLHSFQTYGEQMSHSTHEQNGQGFNMVDATFCTSVAEWVLDGKPMSAKQFTSISKIIRKYSGQIEANDLSSVYVPESALQEPKSSTASMKKTGDGLLELNPAGKFGPLVFHPNVFPSSRAKSLGFKWDKASKNWSADFSLSTFQGLLRQFPGLNISDALMAAVDVIMNPPPVSGLHADLFDYQQEAIAHMLASKRTMLLLAPGLGKTACLASATGFLGGVHIIIAPLTLLLKWKREICKWANAKPENVAIWHGTRDNWEMPTPDENGRAWVITNPETATRQLVRELPRKTEKSKLKMEPIFDMSGFTSVSMDESILVKNRKAKRSVMLFTLMKGREYGWLLSGNPASRFYDDLWHQLHILYPQRFSSYWKFAGMYCELESNQWGMSIVANKRDAYQMILQDCDDIIFARSQDDVLDLPDWLFDDVHVPMSEAQYKPYRQMEDLFWAELPESDEIVLAPNVLAQLTRLIQLASNPALLGGASHSAKMDALEELLEFEEFPMVIWTTFIETANIARDMLEKRGLTVGVLTGQTKREERDEIVVNFEAGKVDVIIAHPEVGKFGLDLVKARTAIYLERSFKGDDYFQSLHRVRRIGTTQSPHVIHLIATSPKGQATVDNAIHHVLDYRTDQSMKLTSGLMREGWK
jgi:hypothetical protein